MAVQDGRVAQLLSVGPQKSQQVPWSPLAHGCARAAIALWSLPLTHQAPAVLSLYADSYGPLSRGLLVHQFSVCPAPSTRTLCSSLPAPHSTTGLPQALSHQKPALQTPSAFLTFPCVLAHLMRVNHSVITISSLSFTRDQITSPCCSTASFPFLSSLLTMSLVQQAASSLIFTIWKTRQHALKSSPPPYLIQILQPCGDDLVLSVI